MLVLPPVICAPISRLMYTGLAGACSTLTWRGSTASSSASSMVSEVYTSWPISFRGETRVTAPSAETDIHALGSNLAAALAA